MLITEKYVQYMFSDVVLLMYLFMFNDRSVAVRLVRKTVYAVVYLCVRMRERHRERRKETGIIQL